MKKWLLVLCSLLAFMQGWSQKVKGLITTQEGKPLAYASVYVKGTNQGTHSNLEGRYSIKLPNGRYTLVCQYVGYASQEAQLVINNDDKDLNFVLRQQEITLAEAVVKTGEDPANQIIRNAIQKRAYYDEQPAAFSCMVYTKGLMRLRDFPKKVLGQKVDFEDGDTSRRKIIYLSETISRYDVSRPDKEKTK